MADTLKHLVGAPQVDRIAAEVAAAWSSFPVAAFKTQAKRGLDALELLDRGRHIGRALRVHLPDDDGKAIAIVTRAMKQAPDRAGDVWRCLPYSALLFAHGPNALDAALASNYVLTQQFTAEFSMRALLIADRDRVLTTLEEWRHDASEHVRRLVSECTRTRLPWAIKVPGLLPARERLVALIAPLRGDESDYVRRSVANHLNDLSKDDPALVLATCKEWLRDTEPKSARWKLCEHALRTLLKRGDTRALQLLGVASTTKVEVSGTITPTRAKLGEVVAITATIRNPSAREVKIRAELVIHFVQKTVSSRRVFRLGEHTVPARGEVALGKRIAMVHRTTRKLLSGKHPVELLVNGRVVPLGSFGLVV